MYRCCEWRNDVTATAITVHPRVVVLGYADSGFTKHPYPICLFNGSALKLTFKYAIWNRDYTAFSALLNVLIQGTNYLPRNEINVKIIDYPSLSG